jgi:hypothetical protein
LGLLADGTIFGSKGRRSNARIVTWMLTERASIRANCDVSIEALALIFRGQPSFAGARWLERNCAGRSVKKSLRFDTKPLRQDP